LIDVPRLAGGARSKGRWLASCADGAVSASSSQRMNGGSRNDVLGADGAGIARVVGVHASDARTVE
jgi:hypothetical protein